LNDLRGGDATAVYDAIYLASQRLGETSAAGGRRRVLVMITDGGDTVHGTHYAQALEQAQRAGVMVYSLIIVPIMADAGRNTGGEHALIQMAEDTGGKCFYVEDAKDLGPAFQKVSDDLRTQYILGYYAPAKSARSRSDGYRALKVQADADVADKITLRYRTGYYAGK
jgi:Ca-activated chloride channel family protein